MKKVMMLFFLIIVAAAAGTSFSSELDKEEIISFSSNITIQPEGIISVTERIKVFAFNRKIVHGIYRDI
ncbi:MAG TPA: hypothetical protein PK307_02215, partial [Spirochaetota bacterium]|nr:hypothetical protein [Spirochaetota bacterium]